MRRLGWVVGIAAILCGCSNPTPPLNAFAKNDDRGLPKFKLVEVLDGNLVQLSESGTILMEPRSHGGYSGSEIQAGSPKNLVSFRDLHYSTATPKLYSYHEGKIDTVPGNSFLDSTGKIRPYLEDRPISVSEKGKKIGLLPLRVPSDHFRYYGGIHSIYASDLKTGEMLKILDRPFGGDIKNFEDTLYMATTESDGTATITVFGPHQASKVLYHSANNYQVYVTDRSYDGTVAIRDTPEFQLQDKLGRLQPIKSSSFDIQFMNFKNAHYMLGFAVTKSAEGKNLFNSPVIWNSAGEPVPIGKLCPELKSKLVRISTMQIGKILGNGSGLVAIEMSGYNQGANNNVGLPDRDTEYVYKTYVFQAIDPTPKS